MVIVCKQRELYKIIYHHLITVRLLHSAFELGNIISG